MLLSVDSISVYYGKARALEGVSIQVNGGEVVAIVGANGAGKTTLLRTISGLIAPSSGQVLFNQNRIDRLPAAEVVRLGIAHVPEGKKLFSDLSVKDNLLMGAYLVSDKKKIDHSLEEMFSYFPILKARETQRAESLSGGEQQMLTIARSLMSRPKLLILDEPTLGLAPMVVKEMGQLIAQLNQAGVSILLVEQNARFAFGLAKRAYVLETGRVILQGSITSLQENSMVREAYLGV